MVANIYPLFFVPIYKDYLWGGNRIKRLFNRPLCPATCAESWEISDRQEGMSIISNGMLSGASLHHVIESMPEIILGSATKNRVFPLLLKIIDAGQRLSVQVHPDARTAESLGGEAKTEMWYILDAEPGAKIFAGFKKMTSPDELQLAISTNRVEDLLNAVPVHRGDSLYIPAGTVHAVGEGCLILEVQQNSNTTYRVYDWNRVDKSGKARELHVASAMTTINWEQNAARIIRNSRKPGTPGNHSTTIITSPFFSVSKIDLESVYQEKKEKSKFDILFNPGATVTVEANGSAQRIAAGTTCLIPAAIPEYRLSPVDGIATLIRISLPDSSD